MKLPEDFIFKTRSFITKNNLPLDGFFESFDEEPLRGIRLNMSKVAPSDYESVMADLGESVDKVTWCDSGFYTSLEGSGNDPYYHAGVYYPQEPSAMLPAQVMSANPGDFVLDMCAAPGGKTCRLAEDMKGSGLLVANEINEMRAKALLRNVERMGIPNAVILNESPENLAKVFIGFFDKILLDVPCSGEGMFRRDAQAVKSWERFGPKTCIPIQREILEAAHVMLKAGGEIVYSTCTFCENEDEDQILRFIELHPEYSVIRHDDIEGITVSGEGFMRIWPHISRGDGHFCVHLKKSEDAEVGSMSLEKIPSYKTKRKDNYGFSKSREAFLEFMRDILVSYEDPGKDYLIHGNRVHLLPVNERIFDGLKVVKLGSYPGEIKPTTTERLFIPSHSLALMLKREEIREDSFLSLSRDDERLYRYLKGETIVVTPEEKASLKKKGYIVIAVNGYPLGFGKISGDGSIKNLYPKAWRTA